MNQTTTASALQHTIYNKFQIHVLSDHKLLIRRPAIHSMLQFILNLSTLHTRSPTPHRLKQRRETSADLVLSSTALLKTLLETGLRNCT